MTDNLGPLLLSDRSGRDRRHKICPGGFKVNCIGDDLSSEVGRVGCLELSLNPSSWSQEVSRMGP